MSNNPYFTPQTDPYSNQNDPYSVVKGPAIALIVVSIICLVAIFLSMSYSAYLLLSGNAANLPQPRALGISKETQITIRLIWGTLILITNTIILIASLKMFRLQSYSLAKAGAILAVIPCIGPCYILGIPFGIWALMVLSKPGIEQAFHRTGK